MQYVRMFLRISRKRNIANEVFYEPGGNIFLHFSSRGDAMLWLLAG